MDTDRIDELSTDVGQLLEAGRKDEAREALNAAHPADVADVLERLPTQDQEELFALLRHELAGEVLLETSEATRSEIVEELTLGRLTQMVQTVDPDEAADIVEELPEEQTEQLLDRLPEEIAEQVQEILQHDPESAGGIMTPVLARASCDMTVGQAIETIRNGRAEDEDVFYLYVVNDQDGLLGVVPIRKLVTSQPDAAVSDILETDVASVGVQADQEEIADTFRRYNYLAMPVVDNDGKLVGQVTVDDVVDVITEEATEDVFKMAGTDDAELATHSVFKVARIRMTWLFACLGGTLVAGLIIRAFEATLGQKLGLMAFVPAIMAMGGNSGIQTSTVTVRGLATGDIDPGLVLGAFLREVRVALALGLICGIVTGLIAQIWLGELSLGIVVGVSMCLGISMAATFGALLPIAVNKFGGDPAVACGPLITTTNDIVSLCIYLGLARLMIGPG